MIADQENKARQGKFLFNETIRTTVSKKPVNVTRRESPESEYILINPICKALVITA